MATDAKAVPEQPSASEACLAAATQLARGPTIALLIISWADILVGLALAATGGHLCAIGGLVVFVGCAASTIPTIRFITAASAALRALGEIAAASEGGRGE